MKKIILSMALIAATTTLFAQKAFKVGLGGAFNSTWLINKNVSDADDELDVAITWGGNFGLNTQFYFNENVGLGLGIMRSGHNQKYTGDFENVGTYDGKVMLRYMDVPLTLRLGGNEKGAYFEFGPQFSFLTKATETYEFSPSSSLFDDEKEEGDVKFLYKPVTVGVVIGFGVDIKAGDQFTISAGLRLSYMGNATKEFDEDELGDEYDDADLDFIPIAAASHFEDADISKDFDYQPTHRILGGIFLGVVYTIPMK